LCSKQPKFTKQAIKNTCFPFFLTHILQNRQNQTNHKSKQNPYPEDYCESIKANWPNFPNKKHSLPGFPIPGSSHHIPGGSIKRERQCVELELAWFCQFNQGINQPLLFFLSPSRSSRGREGEELGRRSGKGKGMTET
jgi:hypothetical protein